MTDVERQKMQQKIEAEIQEKKEQHLTVYRKGSVERPEDQIEMESAIVPMDDVKKSAVKARDLKKEDESESEDEGEDAMNEDINIQENFGKLGGQVVEVELRQNDFGFGLALAGHSNRNRMGTFICGIHPEGSAAENGKIQVGDELLKVNQYFWSRPISRVF